MKQLHTHWEALPRYASLGNLDGGRSFIPSSKVLQAAKQKSPELPPLTSDETGNSARVWVYDGTEFTPITIHTGLADEHWTELLSGPLEAGATLVTDASMDGSSDPDRN